MKVYVDLIFLINFCYDFLLIITVSMVLKRKRKLRYYILSSFIGSLSILLLFLKVNNIILFILKILVSILMCLIAYGYVSILYTLNNLSYLYMTSVILAGFLYFLNNEFSYKHKGIIFFFKGLSINYILLLIIAPIILVLYYKSSKKLKNTYNYYQHIEIYFDNYIIECLGLLDNGNILKDPITGKPIIIVKDKKLKDIHNIRDPIYVPYRTVSNNSLMKCYKPSYIKINNKKIYNYLIGETNCKFKDGVDCLLNNKLVEDNYV